MKRRNYIIFFLTALIFLNGCATMSGVNERTLVRLYAERRKLPKDNVVIFIPGIMGSVLEDKETGRTMWGTLFRGVLDTLALPIDTVKLLTNRDNLVPTRLLQTMSLIPGVVEIDIYDTVSRITAEAGGYILGENMFALSYDWRRDLVEAAKRLDELIERIKEETKNPDIKINLLCHSAGGLIARYYIKYGAVDILDQDPLPKPSWAGARNINKVIMLGTPHNGSLKAFRTLHEGAALHGVGYIKPEVAFTMPSLYEMLPSREEPLFVNIEGQLLNISIFESENWQEYGWSVFSPRLQTAYKKNFIRRHGREKGRAKYEENLDKELRFLKTVLKRSRKFHQALNQGDPEKEKQKVTYILFGSDCHLTLNRILLRKGASSWQTWFHAGTPRLKDLLYDFGDKSVTRESLLGIRYLRSDKSKPQMIRFPSTYEVFVCEQHTELTKSTTYLDNVLNALFD